MAIRAVIFDLDGVVTDTAEAHRHSWKALFDDYLQQRAKREKEEFVPFDVESDYLSYVDGRPRYMGVKTFLESRKINLPQGNPEDSPDQETICGLGNKKNLLFQETLEQEGVDIIDSTLEWIQALKESGIQVAMATSSKNGPRVLQKSNLTQLFAKTVDGNDIQEMDLKGKPEPDMFLEASKRLGVPAIDCAIVEDALSGVRAGQKGHFGAVIGFVRANTEKALKANGADVAVDDLRTLKLSLLEDIQKNKMEVHE